MREIFSRRNRAVLRSLLAMCGLVLWLGIGNGASAASYKLADDLPNVYVASDSLSCLDAARAMAAHLADVFTAAGTPSKWGVNSCERDLSGVVGDSISVDYSVALAPGSGTISLVRTLTIVAVAGTVHDERPASQLMVALIVCVCFGVGVVAGQQR